MDTTGVRSSPVVIEVEGYPESVCLPGEQVVGVHVPRRVAQGILYLDQIAIFVIEVTRYGQSLTRVIGMRHYEADNPTLVVERQGQLSASRIDYVRQAS